MKFPKPSPYQSLTWGAVGLAGTGAYLGMKHGPEGEDPITRMQAGMMYTTAAATGIGAAGYGLYRYGPKKFASHLANGVKWHAGQMKAAYGKDAAARFRTNIENLRSAGKATPEAIASARASAQMKAIPGLLSKGPIMMGAGALLGASLAGEDNRTKGAIMGAGVGAAASMAIGAGGMWKKMGNSGAGKFGKAGMFVALAGMAFGAGESSRRNASVAAAAIPDAETGETTYDSPDAAQRYQSGSGRRARRMQASGDVVLGLNNRRHG